jgi:hypothetical protein
MTSHDATLRQKLAALRAHVAAHGRLPPQRDASSSTSGLGAWVSNQRQAKKAMDAGRKCKHGTMTPARADALEAVVGWA